MKKYIYIMFAAIVMAMCLTACGKKDDTNDNNTSAVSDGKKLQIVTTIFPEYDWVRNILGDKASDADVTMLLDKGVDLHSFQPSADDIMKISGCDIFIYVGGESDGWVDDALKEASNKDMIVINLLDVLGESVKEEEVIEGMQEDEHEHEKEEHSEEDGDKSEDEENEEEGPEYDEHVWLSLKNAVKLADYISGALQKLDSGNADIYKKNAEEYIRSLKSLDGEYQSAVSESSVKTVLFGDRFPFRYMADDYGLSYYAAFVGCSAETEASFETITFLAGKVDELSLHAVLTIEGSDHRIAETIIDNTSSKDSRVLTMDSMQSVTSEDVDNGKTYLNIMENNLKVLKEALNS